LHATHLELDIASYHRLSPLIETRKVIDRAPLLIGRAESADWQLPDPERIVSATHARIEWRDGHYWLQDLSTNGVFINNSTQAIGKSQWINLRDGDKIRIGDYEVSTRIASTRSEPAAETTLINAAGLPSASPWQPSVSDVRSASDASSVSGKTTAAPLSSSMNLIGALTAHNLIDSAMELPPALPTDWNWQETPATGATERQASPSAPDTTRELLQALGLADMFASTAPTPEFMRELGGMVRTLLDQLVDMLHSRAAQKQQARVQQTTFKRSENNPLKFATGSRDALELLLLKQHPAYLPADVAVRDAFADLNRHEHAMLVGLQAVIQQSLNIPDTAPAHTTPRFALNPGASRKTLQYIRHTASQYRSEYSELSRIMRSDAFTHAYEAAQDVNQPC
jgi:type VI secretion system FHA domain protein